MSWPIIDRPALGSTIEAHLTAHPPRAVMLRGPSGIGKTTIARAVADRFARRGALIISIVGLAELHDSPLAPFVPILPRLGIAFSEHPNVSARDVIAAIGSHREPVMVVADDAPLLDGASAAVLYHLLRSYGVPMILTARTDHRVSGPLERVNVEQLVEPIEVGGLDGFETSELLRGHFGSSVRPDDISRLSLQTHGNPLHLREIVRLTELRGLVHHAGAGVEFEPVELPRDLSTSIAQRVDTLDDEARTMLQRITLSSGAPAEAVIANRFERLVVDDLIHEGFVDQRQGGVLQAAHPSYGEAALRSLRAEARDALLEDVAGRLEAADDQALRFTAVRLLCGTRHGAERRQLEWAVRYAYAMGEHLVATEFAQLALQSDPQRALSFSVRVDEASARSSLGQLDAAHECFTTAESLATSSSQFALLVSRWGAHHAYRRFDVPSAIALADRFDPLLTEPDRAMLSPDVHMWRILLGDVTGKPIGLTDDAAAGPEVAVRGAIASVMLDAMGGRISDEAVATLTRVERDHGVLDPFAAAMVHMQRFFALLSQGCGDESAQICMEQRAVCTPDAVGMWTLNLGIHRMYSGRLIEARSLAELAVDQLRWRDPLGFLGFATALQAAVAAQHGDGETVQRLRAQLVPSQLSEPKTAMLFAEAQAVLVARGGDPDGAARLVVDEAERAFQAGHGLVAAISLGICIRLGKVTEAAPLLATIRAATDPQLGLYRALDETATAMQRRDPIAVLAGAHDLARAGMVAAASDALLVATQFHKARTGEMQRRLERAQIRFEGGINESLQCTPPGPRLSGREWEVAGLVLERLSSREIADQLGVSVRTVDNHLSNVYRKLGVSCRAELRDELLGATATR